jgi:hypothetical protein
VDCKHEKVGTIGELYLDASERLAYAGVREMIRSEEGVVAGTTPMRPAERVRLRMVLVTGHVKKTVPVWREEIRLETEPPGGRRASAVGRCVDPRVW